MNEIEMKLLELMKEYIPLLAKAEGKSYEEYLPSLIETIERTIIDLKNQNS